MDNPGNSSNKKRRRTTAREDRPGQKHPPVTMSLSGKIDLFVPGRLCITGEHSDWAGSYRASHPEIHPGYAVVVGTKQGIYANATPIASPELRLSAPDQETVTFVLDSPALLAEARANSFWSYVCGVAYMSQLKYKPPSALPGIHLQITESTLPIKRGLSSSAAVCVLTARAFNLLWKIGLTLDGEMDLAYVGERLTGSPCGRLDQAVAFGSHTGGMRFDGDLATTIKISLPKLPIYMVFADLGAHKDTVRILSALQEAFPSPRNPQDQGIISALGTKNEEIFFKVKAAIEDGDAKSLGYLLIEAQQLFDEAAIPLCPDQLTSPKLHSVLSSPLIQDLIFGGKGVGSQGDGSVQFVAKSREAAERLIQLLETELGCTEAFLLPIGTDALVSPISDDSSCEGSPVPDRDSRPLVRNAVITAAGAGTRLFPASKSIRPKPMMPIIDPIDKRTKPALLILVEECLLRAGLDQVVIVVGPGEEEEGVRNMFAPVSGPYREKLKPWMRDYADQITELGKRVKLVVQETPEGFGHAVYQANTILNGEAFVLLLGDVLFLPDAGYSSCIEQAVNAFEANAGQRSTLGVVSVPEKSVHMYGTLTGRRLPKQNVIDVSMIVEKPDTTLAKQSLRPPPGLTKDDHYLIVLGPYVLTGRMMSILADHVQNDIRSKGEVQLTTAIDELMKEEGLLAVPLNGQALDIGVPEEFGRTNRILTERAFGDALSQ